MAEKLFEDLLADELSHPEYQWLFNKFSAASSDCSVTDFAAYYFLIIRTQTDELIKNNTSTCNTPRKMTMTDFPDSIRSFNDDRMCAAIEKTQNNPTSKHHPRQLFVGTPDSDDAFQTRKSSGQFDTSTPLVSYNRQSRSIEGTPTITSTPTSFKHATKNSFSLNDQSSNTFRNSSKNSLDFSSSNRNNSTNLRNMSSPMCLGDFIMTNSGSSGKGKKKKNASQNSPSVDQEPTKLSSSEFPALNKSSQNQPNRNENKPKKRVVPITVSRNSTPGSSNFMSSSFQSDNNLLNLSAFETEEVDMLSERRMMRDERNAISKNLPQEMSPRVNLHSIIRQNLVMEESPQKLPKFQFDETKVECKNLLTIMARIYSFLLDMNLASNILTEFSYLFNLLNTEYETPEQSHNQIQCKTKVETASNILKNLNNCLFFTIKILNYQKRNLALLDIMTIRVLIENDRIQQFVVELFDHLRNALNEKSQLEAMTNKLNKVGGDSTSKVVLFRQETDNRDNFPSEREFGAFKKQRDMFYQILRSWELKHLDQMYDFKKDLTFKIHSMIILMENPINMAHLAKLFTAQLVISCYFDNSTNELQMDLPNIDIEKLTKLRQRLVAPSQFSTQYLFPGSQAFFRDFIICCDQHMIFMEQLKVSLISELMQINDSSMEIFCITQNQDDQENDKKVREEFIVRAETITTMRVLAKFIGFVVSRPFNFDGPYRNTLVDQKQLLIRNQLHPDFDVKNVVLRAIDGRKLLVTIPWLVEYLSMLDYITIRLDYYRDLFQLLHTIYLKVNVAKESCELCVMLSSKFIIRACLGWIFEHPNLPEEYSNFDNFKNALKVIKSDTKAVDDQQSSEKLNPHLETILNAACPFLADFRVSMMPQRMKKAVSRTGRYRHITTKFQDKTNVQKMKVQDTRERLIEAFLASQTLSIRKIVDFAIDRIFSAVVKDFQVKHLLTIKKQAKAEVEELGKSERDVDILTKKIVELYKRQLKLLQTQWNQNVDANSLSRIKGTFDSLLPVETLADVKKSLINITSEKTREKLQEWSSTNISTIEIFSKDIQLDATKLKESLQQNGNKRTTNNIVIDLEVKMMPSDYFKELQSLLHKASLHPESIKAEDLVKCVKMSVEIVEGQTLPSNAFRNIAFYMLQLMLLCIANCDKLLSKDLLTKVFALWRLDKLKPFTLKDSQNDENSQTRRKVDDFIFSKVISSRFFVTMQGKSRQNLEAYADFLVQLVKQRFITSEQLSEQSVTLYMHEWSPQSLRDIAFVINHIKESLSSLAMSSDSQLMFMDLVVDLARDMENF